MEPQHLYRELLILPEKIRETGHKLLACSSELETTKFQILSNRHRSIHFETIKGSNEDKRNAAVWVLNEDLEIRSRELKSEYDSIKVELEYLKNRLESTQYMVRLVTKIND